MISEIETRTVKGGCVVQKLNGDNGIIYHIQVQGDLDPKWAGWFEGFVMASKGHGETQLTGRVSDQAALYGVLSQIQRLGLRLSLVAATGCPCPSTKCERHGQCQECAAHHRASGKEPFCLRERNKWSKQRAALLKAAGR
jgi:hypothetical protein